MMQTAILTIILMSSVVTVDLKNITSSSTGSIELDDDAEIETICAARKCLKKCCWKNEYVSTDTYSCERFDMNLDFSNVPVYDDYDHYQKISKSLRDIFLLVPGMFYEKLTNENSENEIFATNAISLENIGKFAYMTESGNLYYEERNSYIRWNKVELFCVDYEVTNANATVQYWAVFSSNVKEPYVPHDYYSYALLISSVFLYIVLLVYIILPDLRNLAGLILMAYVFSLMGAFLSLASLKLANKTQSTCYNLTVVIYFFFLSTFCWMNVMSFDIWWTFRGYAKARPIHRRGEKFKFGMYCIYAWGIPTLMAIGLVVINNADLSHIPWFIKPHLLQNGCFLGGVYKLLYLYVPMLILIICNWMFFLMTAFNIWRLCRGSSVLESGAAGSLTAHRSQRNRLMVYLKLSIIMGINWLIEIVSFITPDLKIWIITDSYNLLIGVSIFFIFVCKWKIYRTLRERYYGFVNNKLKLSEGKSNQQHAGV
ncbi:G-protein coupled receptor Mth2-like [Nymphalis io]|uniref:G-protein coupled receptor Mth2-like n=1 Tax=Inachis io TaxID=171585 RepID=UPI002168CCF2|nr:G-protein coupled receptor Mth2-like [Nymphalis io]